MMFVTSEKLATFEILFGKPREIQLEYEMDPKEFDGLLKSQKFGRSHDVTFFVSYEDKWIVIAKHRYPKGLYRIPSGGISPDETIEEGTLREAYEETGGIIDIRKYFLRINVRFTSEERKVDWVSHLILADWRDGQLSAIDTIEIREVRLADRSEFESYGKIMLESHLGGLHYRERLHREAFKILDDGL
jgi:8-oxo-dGTP diphosphatase